MRLHTIDIVFVKGPLYNKQFDGHDMVNVILTPRPKLALLLKLSKLIYIQ